MELFGKDYTIKQLRQRVGRMDQVAGIRLVQLDDGNERPQRAALVHTGSGLEFTLLIDRALDISAASFNGQALAWRSSTGDVAPQYFEPEGARWLRSFFGGLVATCGCINVGAPIAGSELSGEGIHGRIGNLPARDLKVTQEWQGDDYILRISGTMRETRVFGESLALTRTISTKLGSKTICLRDVLTNEGFKPQPYQFLYHCNIGWPIVDEGSEILSPSQIVAPRDADAVAGKEDWMKIDAPTHNYAEKCYYHEMQAGAEGWVNCAIVNSGFQRGNGLGVALKYRKAELPRFTQWKMMDERDYVVGLEPCNCGVEGRDKDEALGLLPVLEPGETKEYALEFTALSTETEVDALRQQTAQVKTRMVKSYQEFVQPPK